MQLSRHRCLTRLSLLLVVVLHMAFATRLFSTMSSATKNKVVFPSRQSQSATLFFLHGLGDSARGGWSDVVPEFQRRFPNLKVVLPDAPNQPVTLNGGMRMQSWYDIVSLNSDNAEYKGLEDTLTNIEAMLNEEIESGTPSNKIILAGFSQGGSVSLYTGLRFGQTLAGIAALSGRLPYSKAPETFAPLVHAANKATPLIQLHGEADQVVKFSVGQRSHEVIQLARPDNLTFKAYRGMGHHSSDEELKDLMDWMAKCLQA